MNADKQALNSSNENTKIFSGELFVTNNLNENESESNNNSLRKSTSNSIRGSLNLIRNSVKSNHSNNNERFLTHSLMQDLRGSMKKDSDKRLEFEKLRIKDQLQLNKSQLSINSNSNSNNNINEEDVLANIKLPKADNNQQKSTFDDLYEDVNEDEGEAENEEKYDNEENNEIEKDEYNNDQMDDNININQLTKVNQYFNKYRKNIKRNENFGGENKNEGEEMPLSLRSSSNSACISSHSNNSNGNLSVNMNMRSSKIFNKVKKDTNELSDNNSSKNLVNFGENNNISSISNNSKNENDTYENNNSQNNDNNINNEIKYDIKENNSIKDKNNEQNFINNNALNVEIKNINNVEEEDKIKLEMQIMQFENENEKANEKENEMEKEKYVFEKFGKMGWECEKCSNFNFESRTICNRCEAPKQPKSLEQIKIENEQKSVERKKKPLIERKGDWQCPICHNLNFAFRQSCNRCKLSKEVYLKIISQQVFNDKNMNNGMNVRNSYTGSTQIINNSAPQLIQNQFNFFQWGIIPIYNPNFTKTSPFTPAFQLSNNKMNLKNNMNSVNNINNDTLTFS